MTYSFEYKEVIHVPTKANFIVFVDYEYVEYNILNNNIHLPKIDGAKIVQIVEYWTNEEKIQILEKYNALLANKKIRVELEELRNINKSILDTKDTVSKLDNIKKDYIDLLKDIKKEFDDLYQLKHIVVELTHKLEANRSKYERELDSIGTSVKTELDSKIAQIQVILKDIKNATSSFNTTHVEAKKILDNYTSLIGKISKDIENKKNSYIKELEKIGADYLLKLKKQADSKMIDIDLKAKEKISKIDNISINPRNVTLIGDNNKKYSIGIKNGRLQVKEI